MARHAAAYIRRSSVSADSPGDASREAQLDAARRLAAAFAPDAEIREYVDWGISGRRDDRPEYVRLKAAIAADEVCCVFAYSLSRLGRTARELDALFTLCEQHDVQVITQADGTLTATSATGKFLRRILAELAELESELAKERSAAARAAKRDRGDEFGQPPYGYKHAKIDGRIVRVPDPDRPVQPLIDAYREAGTILGACRLLEERNVPAPRGGTRWATSALTRILEENAPDLLPRRTARGVRQPASARLSQLVKCPHCGKMMTPNVHRGQLYCSNGPRARATHPRYVVREIDLLPWVQEQAARFRRPAGARVSEDDQHARDAIAARLERAHELYIAGDIDRSRYADEKARADRELERLQDARTVVDVPEIDWDRWDPADVNAVLRSLWSHIELDAELRPVRAEWRIPAEWVA